MTDERLPHPEWMRRFPWNVGLAIFPPGDVRATPAQLAEFRRYATVGDPPADAVVAMMRRLPAGEGRRLFDQAVDHGIDTVDDPPPELVDFFAHIDAVPYWLDRSQLDRGARVITRTGLFGMLMVMPSMGLFGGYLASRADKTLLRTGELDAMAPRRLAETANWWVDVTTPGGLDRYGAGFSGTLRVRIMHAQVRAAMRRRADWDHDAWDEPVNQIQLVGTLLLFSLVLLVGSRALGLQFSARDKAANLHLWRYVGHLMGVDPRLLPVTEADAWRLLWLMGVTEFQPDGDSQRLGKALLAATPAVVLPGALKHSPRLGRALTDYLGSYSRLVLGKRNADLLGAPDVWRFQAAVIATAAINFPVETARRLIPGATRLAVRIGHVTRHRMIGRILAEQRGDRAYDRHDAIAEPSAPATANA